MGKKFDDLTAEVETVTLYISFLGANADSLFEAEDALDVAGYDTTSCADYIAGQDFEWSKVCAALLNATAVVTLDGWVASSTARVEVALAHAAGIPVFKLGDVLGYSTEDADDVE